MVEFSETFELDCGELDQDHRRLIEMLNEIVAMLDDGKTGNCKSKVQEFVNFSKAHFRREERFLAKAGYPGLQEHCEHHIRLNKKMDHILEFADMAGVNEKARESLKKELVFFLMDDVITTDLDFKSFIEDKRL